MLVMQAILSGLGSGCAWRLLPKAYPPYSTVYYYFRKWRDDGSWKRIHDHLVQWVRVASEPFPSPSAASLDSQSVPTAVMVHESVGYDAAKKVKGRKRFVLVDTLGLLVAVQIVSANVPERQAASAIASAGAPGTPSPTLTSDYLGRWWVFRGRVSPVGDGYLPLGYRGRCATSRSSRLCASAQAWDSRAHLRWVALVPSPQCGLRAITCLLRSLHLHCDDSTQATQACLRCC